MAEKQVLAIIPARGGSKGVPGKNIRMFCGKPLIAHSIDVARACPSISRTVVSTDDDAIAAVAKAQGAQTVARPDALATDDALIIDAVKDTVHQVEALGDSIDVVVVLEPTSPMRRSQDIERCIQMVSDNQSDSAAAFTDSHVPPTRLWRIEPGVVEPYIDGAVPFLPRQQQPRAFELTGQIYVLSRHILFDQDDSVSLVRGRVFPLITPQESTVDIDTERDFMLAEKVMEHFWLNESHQDNTDDN